MNQDIYFEDRVKCNGNEEGDETATTKVVIEQFQPQNSNSMNSLDIDPAPKNVHKKSVPKMKRRISKGHNRTTIKQQWRHFMKECLEDDMSVEVMLEDEDEDTYYEDEVDHEVVDEEDKLNDKTEQEEGLEEVSSEVEEDEEYQSSDLSYSYKKQGVYDCPEPHLIPVIMKCKEHTLTDISSHKIDEIAVEEAEEIDEASASEDSSEIIEFTPTWVGASVSSVIIVLSLYAERILHCHGKFLKHKQQDALFQDLQKVKEELILLSFISLLLTVFQSSISHICITKSAATQMLPCKKEETNFAQENPEAFFTWNMWETRRLLSGGGGTNICSSQGKVPILSLEALHQLHIFIFVLTFVHVVFSTTTMVLGGVKIRQCKHWEKAIQKENSNVSNSERLPHRHPHHEFIRTRAMGYWRKSVVVSLVMSFFKKFHASVTKSDYREFQPISHCPSFSSFLEDTVKVIKVGIKNNTGLENEMLGLVLNPIFVEFFISTQRPPPELPPRSAANSPYSMTPFNQLPIPRPPPKPPWIQ